MDTAAKPHTEVSKAAMQEVLTRQKAAQLRDGAPSAEMRIDRLERCIKLLKENAQAIVDALDRDFGARSKDGSMLTDIASSIGSLKNAQENVRKWMRPEKRKTGFPMSLLGGKSAVLFQPKGVVGVIAPWNFPWNLTMAPLSGVLAAGNRAMIKPSEFTPESSALMETLFKRYFKEDEIAVINGGPETGAAFASLAFGSISTPGCRALYPAQMSLPLAKSHGTLQTSLSKVNS